MVIMTKKLIFENKFIHLTYQTKIIEVNSNFWNCCRIPMRPLPWSKKITIKCPKRKLKSL